MKREFLQLAHPYKGEPIGGWYWSVKLDGCRAYWDGGLTRGLSAADVPFANTTKDHRYITPPKATGLWSRYGKPIQAPNWWLDLMPSFPLDGELYIERGQFQTLMSTVKTIVPGPGWDQVKYMAFDSPPYHAIFANGEINNVNFKKEFRNVVARLNPLPANCPKSWDFHSVYHWLQERCEVNRVLHVHEQNVLPHTSREASAHISETLDVLLRRGDEGIMLRHPTSLWAPQRCRTLLKVKGMNDAEGTVVGYVWGRETDKGSKLLGLMGALVLKFQGKTFELSGFTDQEREMCFYEGVDHGARAEGIANPGKPVRSEIHNPTFPVGSQVSFKFRELTDAGIPKEARYWRKRDE